jgi:hypothetical protein
MKRRIGCLLKLIFVFAGALVGLLAGLRGPDLVHRGVLVRWMPFDLPDNLRAVRFLEGEGPHVFIEAEDGKRYSHGLSFGDSVEWHELDPAVTLDQADQPMGDGQCRLSAPFRHDLIVLPSLTRVADRIYCINSEHAEYYGDLQFIIDGSGGVWRWLRTDFGLGILGWYPICGVVGVLSGALLGWLLHTKFARLIGAHQEDQVEEARDRWHL